MLKGAIIGLGNVAVNGHLPGWEGCEQARIVAAVDAIESRLVEARRCLPTAGLYTDIGALLTSESLDFLDICTPPGTHASLACRALEKGLHVLCEKPLVLSPEELRVVRRAQTESGRVLHTVHNWWYAPIILMAADLIGAGRIGTIRRIDWRVIRCEPSVAVQSASDAVESATHSPSTTLRTGNWRLDPVMAGGGILLDHGWHALYIILRWLGDDPKTIAASLEKRAHPEWPVEDTATVRLNFQEAVVDMFLTWASSSRSNSAVIEGTLGTILIDDDVLSLADDSGRQRWTFEQPLSRGSHHPDWFSHVRDDFLREISDEAHRGENLVEASLCAQLLNLAKESDSQGGQTLTVS